MQLIRFLRLILYISMAASLALSIPLASAMALDNPPIVRVKLDEVSGAVSLTAVQGSYQVVDGTTGLPLVAMAPGDTVQIAPQGLNLTVTKGKEPAKKGQGGVWVKSAVPPGNNSILSYDGKKYRGDMRLSVVDGKVLVVNHVDIESYLYGVVGPEMGASAPMEALKAQAVVSRTYVLANMNKNALYDVQNTVASQVFKGMEGESPNAVQAVNDTKGQVIYYQNKLIKAYFHANAGGYTENSENVWNESLPYLKATPSPDDAYAVTQGSYGASTYQWEISLSRSELETRLKEKGFDIGTLTSIKVSKESRDNKGTTLSGRVTEVEFVGTKGTKTYTRDSIRSILGTKSTLFDLYLDGNLTVLDAAGAEKALPGQNLKAVGADGQIRTLQGPASAAKVVSAAGVGTAGQSFNKITIKGKGYGHGLGMSQWGARGMAAKGNNFQQIIEHYYNGDKRDGNLQIRANYG